MLHLTSMASGAPNALAVLALLLWPAAALLAFSVRRGTASLASTVAWLTVLPEMFLPANCFFKLPGIPNLDKHRLIFIAVAAALALFHPRRPDETLRGHFFARFILAGLVAGAVMTVRTNGDVLSYGRTLLPALSDHDIVSMSGAYYLDWYLPFVIGQRVFRTESDLRDLFRVLGLGALIYAPFFLVELRFSPQFHRWVYGYHQHQFAQAIRGGGYRPTLFWYHGAGVAMFLMSGFCAGLGLSRAGARTRPRAGYLAAIAGALVVLSKSAGATVYTLVAWPALRLISPRWLGRVVLLLALFVLGYPAIRAAELFPKQEVVQFFAQFSEERADSLDYRFNMEEDLLARARERPLFGWGSWGRNRVYDAEGIDRSVTDGWWTILLGAYGYVGFAGYFGLLAVPLLRYAWRRRRLPTSAQPLVGTLALLVTFLAVDCLPNSPFDFFPMMYAGALFGVVACLGQARASRAARGAARQARAPEPVGPGAGSAGGAPFHGGMR